MKLWKHQREAINLTRYHDNFALFFEMGTGKTATVIRILARLYNEANPATPEIQNTLILAPKIVLKQWKLEFRKFSEIPQHHIHALTGTSKNCIKVMHKAMEYEMGNIFIINYEKLLSRDIFGRLKSVFHPSIIVCDESHLLKTHNSRRSKLVELLADNAEHKYLLTGTPILNSALDIFQQYRILDGGELFGKNYFAFRAKFFEDKNHAWSGSHKHFPNWKPRANTYEKLNKLIYSKAMRVTKEECMDLPPLVRQTVEVELSADQKRMYKEMKRDFLTVIRNEVGDSPVAVAKLAVTKALRLQQIVTGHVKDEFGVIHHIDASPRINALKELLATITKDNKVIVWCAFKDNYLQVAKVCDDLELQCVEIHGEISPAGRDIALESFKHDDLCKVMIANQKAGGTGLDGLQVASYSIYFSKSFSYGDDIQSMSRNHRGGSEIHDKVTRIDIVANATIDELVTSALARKEDVSEQILERKDEI